jgi:hypothetical protein
MEEDRSAERPRRAEPHARTRKVGKKITTKCTISRGGSHLRVGLALAL